MACHVLHTDTTHLQSTQRKHSLMHSQTHSQSIHLGSSSRRVSSCSSNSNTSSHSESFRSKNTTICDNLRSEDTSSFPPCSTALQSNAQVTTLLTDVARWPHGDEEHRDFRNRATSTITLLTLTVAALPSMLQGTPGRRGTSCSWFGSNRLGILKLAVALSLGCNLEM